MGSRVEIVAHSLSPQKEELITVLATEHCARAMSDNKYRQFVKGKVPTSVMNEVSNNAQGWCYNLKGFIPYRYIIDNKMTI